MGTVLRPTSERPAKEWIKRVWPTARLPPYRRDELTTAYHEAGHIVLCDVFSIPIKGAMVEGTGGKVSLVRNEPPASDVVIPQEVTEQVAIELATMYVGGIVAEMLLCGVDVQGKLLLENRDFRNAEMVLSDAFTTTGAMYYVQRLARALLIERWGQVQAVADALRQRGDLSAAELKAIMAAYKR